MFLLFYLNSFWVLSLLFTFIAGEHLIFIMHKYYAKIETITTVYFSVKSNMWYIRIFFTNPTSEKKSKKNPFYTGWKRTELVFYISKISKLDNWNITRKFVLYLLSNKLLIKNKIGTELSHTLYCKSTYWILC